jgi:hypothetical protein
MFEAFTGWKIGVEVTDADRPYIIVPEQQLARLCSLLTDHCIPHEIDGAVPSRHHADSPFAMVVRLGLVFDLSRVQEILDLVP